MLQQTFAPRVRLALPLVIIALIAAGCNLGAQPSAATVTPVNTLEPTLIALSDVPEVEIRSPADNSEAVLQSEVQVYVRAVDKVGVTRIEMNVDGLIVDTAAAPQAAGVPLLDSILSWTPQSVGPHVVEAIAYRGSIKGNPKHITLTVRDNPAQVTNPASSPVGITAQPTDDPSCRVQTTVSDLNVRTGPDVIYPSITTLAVGTTLPVTGSNDDRSWWQVNAQGQIGWVSAAYVTPLGICTTILSLPIPPSPIGPINPPLSTQTLVPAPNIILPTIVLPPPTSTIPIVVLPTFTPSPIVVAQVRPASIGDLSSTAIFATETALAQPPPPLPTATSTPTLLPGITASPAPTYTPSNTATITPTPLLANLVVVSAVPGSTTIILNGANQPTLVPFAVTVSNTGQADAPVFDIGIRTADGRTVTAPTQIVLAPGASTNVSLIVQFTQPGTQTVTVIADINNVVLESNKFDNTLLLQVDVLQATQTSPTSTNTLTFTPLPTLPPSVTSVLPTASATLTQVPPTVTGTQTVNPGTATPTTTLTSTKLASPTATVTQTIIPGTLTPTTTLTSTKLASPTPTVTLSATVHASTTSTPVTPTLTTQPSKTTTVTATPTVHITQSGTASTTAQPSKTVTMTASLTVHATQSVTNTATHSATPLLPSATYTNTAKPSTATSTLTQIPPSRTFTPTSTSIPATLTHTNTPIPATLTHTNTPIPPSATHTNTAIPASATYTSTPVPPTHTNTPVLPTATRTNTPVPPSATRTNTAIPASATYTSTPVPPTHTSTPVLPTATRTNTPIPPSATHTNTPVPPTRTNTTIPPTATHTSTPMPPTPTHTNTLIAATATSTHTLTPTAEVVVDLKTVPILNLNDPQVVTTLKDTQKKDKKNKVSAVDFSLIGDATLHGASEIGSDKMNLDTFKAQYDPVVQYFANAFKAIPQRTQDCASKQPLECALAAKSATGEIAGIALISLGKGAMDANVPVAQFRQDLTTLTKELDNRGIVPVLVTIPGPIDNPTVAKYNAVIYDVATANHLPLFNLYRIAADKPTLLDANGALKDPGQDKRAIFTSAALDQFGVNAANLQLLALLDAIKTIDATP